MDLTRLAAAAVVVGSLAVSVAAAGLFGVWWGVLTTGLFLIAGGVARLRSPGG